MKVLFALATAATATAVTIQRPELTLGWNTASTSLAGDVSVKSTDRFEFHVVVQDQNIEELRQYVAEISDPDNEKFGEFMTVQEVSAFTAPNAEDTKVIQEWIEEADGCDHWTDEAGRHIWVQCSVSAAEDLLETSIVHMVNSNFNQEVIRANDYTIPDDIHNSTAAIFGLHGLPLPPRKPLIATLPKQPANVTPAVIAATYNIGGVTPKGTTTNRMAVAEFQGQNEKDSDLATFFKEYVPDAQPGDEKVYKFVGDPDKQEAGVEASLDIQYIMGVAPHIKAEFWLLDNMDFCKDLGNWTDIILQDTTGPHVHSVSYGWQGNLTQVQCTNEKVEVVDNNFVKLAATRATIIFASGDSGSGYAPARPDCSDTETDVSHTGEVEGNIHARSAAECCEIAANGAGYTYTPPPGNAPVCSASSYGKKDTAYEGTTIEHVMLPSAEPQVCCEIAQQRGAYFTLSDSTDSSSTDLNCSLFEEITGTRTEKGSFSDKMSSTLGNCTIFSVIQGTRHHAGSISGASKQGKVTLYPSWPASSPYVTSVGATRFVNHEVGQPEMASDQFGSGGGFSDMFDQTHASWQTEAVAHYTSNPPQDPHYPPKGTFDPNGRATPDVCALGEGYQVVANGVVEPVGGTSASTPAFAGMLALINEAREQAGKPAMGFLNAFLYKNADCFTDVTLGTNAIGRGTGPSKYGFNATEGWDPATGLGSPIFDKLLAAALKV